MASEKVKQILRAKAAPFSKEELENMSDQAGWQWLYSNHPPKKTNNRNPKKLPEVCFTGFTDEDKKTLKTRASEKFWVTSGITKNCKYLVLGPHPGSTKLEMAEAHGIKTLTPQEFEAML